VSSSQSARAAGSASVSAGDNFFAPPSITIQVGETVTWSNDGQVPHTVTANSGSFDSGNLNPGQSFSHEFSSPGNFSYFCAYHASMKGTVTVQESGSGGGGETSTPGALPTTTTPTGPGSESAAGASPDAAGTDTQLPSTGIPLVPLLGGGGVLVALGALLRRRARVS
jgi:plastocyanin